MPAELGARIEQAMHTSERRHITVLFADVVGFTALSERLDPEDVREIMAGVFSALATVLYKRGAYIEKFIGDAIVAIFGAPVSHDDDAIRACSAALAMQAIVHEREDSLQLRIGINTGLAITGPVGDGSQYGATGDTVNVAARFEQNAAPGSILMSAATRQLVRNVFIVEPVAPLVVKGKDRPLAAFALLPGPSTVDTISTCPFVGRESELQVMDAALTEARDGTTQLLRIVGEPGVGKTALLSSFLAGTAPRASSFHASCRADEQEAYALVKALLSSIFVADGLYDETQQSRVSERLRDLGCAGHEFLLSSILGLPCDDPYQHSHSRPVFIRRAVRDLVAALAENDSLIIAIEDIHWADPDSLDLLNFLVMQLEHAPILIIVTDRSETTKLSTVQSRYRQLPIGPLNREQSTQVAESLLSSSKLPTDVLDSVVQRAEGIPLFLHEIVRWMLDQRTPVQRNDLWEVSEGASERIPGSIQAVITARLDLIDVETRHTLQLAAVIGREFDLDLLESVSDRPVLGSVLDAERSRLVEENLRSSSPGIVFQFCHALLRQVAYDMLLNRKRAEFHARVGRAIEVLAPMRLELLAYHWGRAGDNEKAFAYAASAGRAAAARFALGEAESQLSSAIEIAEHAVGLVTAGTLLELYEERGVVRLGKGSEENAIVDFETVLKLAKTMGDKGAEGRAHARLGQAYWILHQSAPSVDHAETARAIATGASDPKLQRVLAEAITDIGQVQGHLGRALDSRRNVEEGLRLSRNCNYQAGIAQAQGYLAILDEWQGRFADCIQRSPEAIESAVEARDPYKVLYNRWVFGLGLCGAGRYNEAVATFGEVERQARDMGSSIMVVRAMNALGWVYGDLYDPAGVVRLTEPALQIGLDNNLFEPVANSRINLAEAYVSLDDLEVAERLANAAADLVDKDPWMRWRWKTRLAIVLADVKLRQNRFDDALEHVQEGLDIARERESRRHIAKLLVLEGRCLVATGNCDRALVSIRAGLAYADETGNPPCRWDAHYWMARTLRSEGDSDYAFHFEAADALVTSTGATLTDNGLRAQLSRSALARQVRSKRDGRA